MFTVVFIKNLLGLDLPRQYFTRKRAEGLLKIAKKDGQKVLYTTDSIKELILYLINKGKFTPEEGIKLIEKLKKFNDKLFTK